MVIKFFSMLQAWKFAIVSYLSHLFVFFVIGCVGSIGLLFYTLFAVGFIVGSEQVDYFISHMPDAYTFFVPLFDSIFQQPVYSLISFIIGIILFAFYDMALMALSLRIYDTQSASIFTFFRPRFESLSYSIALVSYYAMTALGLMLFIMPGVVWYSRYYFMGFFIIDKHVGMEESFPRSTYLTWGVRMRVLLFSLLNTAIFIALMHINMYIAFFCAMPLMALARTYAYRQLLKTSVMPMSIQEGFNI